MQLLDSLIDGAQELPVEEREHLYRAYIEYLRYGREPELDGLLKALWVSVLPNLENSRTRATAGRAGGKKSPKGGEETPAPTGKRKPKAAESPAEDPAPLDPLGEPVRAEAEHEAANPTPEEVAQYVAASGGTPIDAQAFVAHYASVGWVDTRGRKIVNWRPLALRWSREDRDRAATEAAGKVSANDYAQYR